jgi:hypothetical protein
MVSNIKIGEIKNFVTDTPTLIIISLAKFDRENIEHSFRISSI